jgi:competence protein ComEA
MDGFDFQELFYKYRYHILIFFAGILLVALGFFFFKNQTNSLPVKVEVMGESVKAEDGGMLTAEIAGEVTYPGVYRIPDGSRVDDLITIAGGLTVNTDTVWTDKYLNRAAKLTDGQKVFIPPVDNHSNIPTAKKDGGDQTVSGSFSSDSNSLIDINTASLSQLDTLPGIGQKYGQSIIEHRPYSNTLELVSKEVIGKNLYEKIKDKISVY